MAIDHLVVLIGVALVGIGLAVFVAFRHGVDARATGPLPSIESRIPSTHHPLAPPPEGSELAPEEGLDWLAQAADELRTPLSVLRGHLEQLRRQIDTESPSALIPTVERIVGQVARLEGLIDAWAVSTQVRDENRLPSARPVDLMTLGRGLCARITTLDEPPFDVDPGPPVWALVDPNLIEHALGVLLRSARRAHPFGLVELVVRVVGQGTGQRICLAVADRREQRRGNTPDLWEALELDLARVLIEEHGGWLELEDRAGGGAVTILWLPARLLIPTTSLLRKSA